jgi:co-chaperonin GroES (HSP10)
MVTNADKAGLERLAALQNDSGLIPTEFCVVVRMDAAPEKVGSLYMPPNVTDRDKLAADEGTLVAVSPLAFTYENWPEGSRKPQVGDRVVFRKFAGLLRTNKENGKDFRLLNDKDIVAIVEAPQPGNGDKLRHERLGIAPVADEAPCEVEEVSPPTPDIIWNAHEHRPATKEEIADPKNWPISRSGESKLKPQAMSQAGEEY